jgi:tetratricopeptide (TPR) repeat protein
MTNDKKPASGVPYRLPNEPIVAGGIPQQPRINLQQVMGQAEQLQAQGELQKSEGLLRQILQNAPNFAPAIHLLGVIAHQSGKADMAMDLITKAIEINDQVPLFHANLGEMYRLKENLDKAIEHGEKAVVLDPGMASAHSNLGIAYYDKEDIDKARVCHEKALSIDNNLAPSLNNLGSISRKAEDAEKAMEYYHKAIAANPGYLEPMNNLGLVLIEKQRFAEAISPLTNAIQQNPNYADAQCNLGFTYSALDKHDKAFPCFQKALEIRPEYREALVGLTGVYMGLDMHQEAETTLKKALALDEDKAELQSMLAGIYNELALLDKADECYEKALELDPELVPAYMGRGHMLMEQGDFDKAEENFIKGQEFNEDRLGVHFAFTQLRKVTEDNEHFKALKEVEDVKALKNNEAINYYYALGKCHDDIGEHEKAFEYYIQGAKMKRETLGYDVNSNESLANQIKAVFKPQLLDRLKVQGHDSNVPIFVLGMPRSGTTLTEQIIASHPDVYGAGELRDLKAIANRITSNGIKTFPTNLAGLSPDVLKQVGEQYVAGLKARAPGSPHITDKMPGNFQLVGLIHLAMPNAKIVHVRRNPLDTCISCFTRLFRHNQNQSYDLYEQGRFYRDYYNLMQHWRDVLPEGAFYEVVYEDLVQDNENQTRALIEYCGLDWDDACLQSHKTKRTIKTASITQVRQPIYTSSLERWKRYDKFLDPLKEGLGDVPY